jgi:hypothetical protein
MRVGLERLQQRPGDEGSSPPNSIAAATRSIAISGSANHAKSRGNAYHGACPFSQGRQVEQFGALGHNGRCCEAEGRSLSTVAEVLALTLIGSVSVPVLYLSLTGW